MSLVISYHFILFKHTLNELLRFFLQIVKKDIQEYTVPLHVLSLHMDTTVSRHVVVLMKNVIMSLDVNIMLEVCINLFSLKIVSSHLDMFSSRNKFNFIQYLQNIINQIIVSVHVPRLLCLKNKQIVFWQFESDIIMIVLHSPWLF